MAEQQAEAYKKKQEELRNQYEKEQDLHENKAMLSKDSKDKLSMNFMYEPPPGVRKDVREKDDNEPEYKFEWQRQYNAPRESYCKGDTEIRDQPFGIQVRNVRCIKCHKWGHINTDKECTMYSISMSEARKLHSEAEANEILSKNMLEEQMKEDGLMMKKGAMSAQSFQNGRLHQFVANSNEDDNEAPQAEKEFLKSLSTKQKKKLLKKLKKIEKMKQKSAKRGLKKKSKKHSSGSRSSLASSSSSSSSDSEDEKKVHRSRKSDDRDDKRHKARRHTRSRSRSPKDRKNRRDRVSSRDRSLSPRRNHRHRSRSSSREARHRNHRR